MLVIRTNHDIATHYIYAACESVIALARKKGFSVVDIASDKVEHSYIKKRFQAKPKFVFMNAHGTAKSLLNKEKEVLTTEDAHLFTDTIAYARSCDCVQELGHQAVKEGCRAFIGYKREFVLPRLAGYASRPLSDPVAQPVLEASNTVAELLVRGKTVKESVMKSHEVASKHIVDLIYARDPYMTATLPALVGNDAVLTYEGDGEVKL